jgi:radical SAM superfamily enzyme YgiQ (UPF0313 family)
MLVEYPIETGLMLKQNIMKIAFVNPRYFEEDYRFKVNKLSPPLGMAILASMLRLNKHEVKLFDLEALRSTVNEQIDSFATFAPDIIGVFGTSPINKYIKETIAVLRFNFPSAKIIVGGPHATLFPDDFLENCESIDYIFRGEAEYSIVEFVHQISLFDDVKFPDKIEGIVYKSDETIYRHPIVPKVKDLNELPFPSYDLLPLERYFETGSTEKVITMMTSRGCPYDCIYCADPVLYGHRFRSRSAKNVVEEMKYLSSQHQIKHIVFYDANFNADIERVRDICRLLIAQKLDVTWRARVRADKIDRETVELMKEAGCTELSLGVESGSEKVLKIIHKKESRNEIRKAFEIIKEFDIWLVGYFMFGIPGETPSDAEETINFAIELDPDWALFSIATPLPGTEFLRQAKLSNWIISDDLNNYKANFDTPVVSYENFTSDLIKQCVNRAYEKFYLRKEWLVNRLIKAKSRSQILNIINSYKFYEDKIKSLEPAVTL